MGADSPPTIIAVCTPRGRGGIGMVRLSGPRALAIGRGLFRCRPDLGAHPRRVRYGRIVDATGLAVDTGLAWFFSGPASYTGEDVVEISGHGSDAALDLVVEAGQSLGAVAAEPGEFTRRAFLNGRMDLLQAEAVADLIHAQGQGGLRAAYGVLSGGLSQRVLDLEDALVSALARLEALLDFSDDVSRAEVGDVDALVARVELGATALVQTFAAARTRLDGFTVALVGRPNVGKSTLLNALLGEERSIVTEVPGTTRDWVEGRVAWHGESIRLVDTAGLRPSQDPVEVAGMARSLEQAAAANLVLLLREPGETGPAPAGLPPGAMTVWTKADLGQPAPGTGSDLRVSAKTGAGLEELREAILRHVPRGRGTESGAPLRERHRAGLAEVTACARRARALLEANGWEVAATEMQSGLRQIGELLGKSTSEAVLDRIFAEFCIGK